MCSSDLNRLVKLINSIPTLVRIYIVNLKIDKNYKRLNREDYKIIIKEAGYKIVNIEKTYAGQANMFVLKK